MAITRALAAFERGPLADVRRRTLAQIPTHFGRLIYLAGLRSLTDGTYEHHGLDLVFGSAQANEALAQAHLELFIEWINKPVAAQKSDLDRYLSSLRTDKTNVLNTWVRLKPYRNLVPAGASTIEENLFISDFEALLSLLINVYGDGSLRRDE